MNASATGSAGKRCAWIQLVERETDDRRGQERDEEVHDEPARGGVVAEANDHAEEARAVLPYHREHRAGLDDDLEELALLVVEAEQLTATMRWPVRNREELRESLDDAENQRLDARRSGTAAEGLYRD